MIYKFIKNNYNFVFKSIILSNYNNSKDKLKKPINKMEDLGDPLGDRVMKNVPMIAREPLTKD
jgi:hypothetical protein